MARLHVHFFGKCQIRLDSQPIEQLDARKVQELFCYLLLHRDQPHAREVLAGVLWGESSTAQSKKSLRQTLWQLQAGLGSASIPAPERLLLIDSEWIQVNPHADLWFDVAEFEQAFRLLQHQPGNQLDQTLIDRLRTAVDLYQADLLEGWYQDWCVYERERFQNMYLTMLDRLMIVCEQHQQYDAGLDYGARILRCDRAHERTHRRLMSLYYRSGDRAAALRQYQRCRSVLQEELGVEPSRTTSLLYSQIQADNPNNDEPARLAGDPQPANLPLDRALSSLKQCWHDLAAIEQRIHADLDSLERAIQNMSQPYNVVAHDGFPRNDAVHCANEQQSPKSLPQKTLP